MNFAQGYLILKKNYLKRYDAFCGKNEWMINPYYVDPKYRRQGIADTLIKKAIEVQSTAINALVVDGNIASLNALKRNGFIEKDRYKAGWKIKNNKEGNLILLRFEKKTK